MESRQIYFALTLLVLVIFLPSSIPPDGGRRWIVWNVGQGQWVSLVGDSECWHFDTGGERMNWQALVRLCGARRNRIFLSHWDEDHIGFATQTARRLNACLQSVGPAGAASPRKQKRLARLPRCQGAPTRLWTWRPEKAAHSNDLSQVFVTDGILLPGDSPKSQEKTWARYIPDPRAIFLLVLGHHGSQTSTSTELLERLPNLRMAIASARSARYGHPHRATMERLRGWRIPLLRTEDWGTIAIEL